MTVDRHTKNDRYRCVIDTSAGAITYRIKDGKLQLLLVRPSELRNVWGAPKGHVEPGENFSQAAIREVREETGINVALEEAMSPVYDYHENRSKRVMLFLAQPTGDDEPWPNDGENFDVAWHDADDLPSVHLYQRDVIVHARRYIDFKISGVVPRTIMEKFELILSYAASLDDWIEIKKLIVRELSVRDRRMFSRRHEVTNMQQTNTLEKMLGALWEERTGRSIVWPRPHRDNT